MKVHTYYAPVQQLNPTEQREMLGIWETSWRMNGWEPVVLGPRDAARHPWSSAIESYFRSLPTTNPAAYELACWMRWVAMSMIGGLMTDYDVMCFGLTPDDLPANSGIFTSILGDHNPCPCAVNGMAEQYSNMVRLFLDHGGDSAHTSDQNVIQAVAAAIRPHIHDLCPEYTARHWKTAKMIHVSHGSCHGKDRMEILRNIVKLRSAE